ncbi:nucleoside deaminase [Streptomyces sp. NRRL WC-3549]|uniref:nucleoside deaminase n=1 Tax=Streptomyces sp. NRRL WC-3549 TaxID=1463925 RepID=UPI0004CA9179|nr:nucleoside deaminase [Streptomyces sp. NRRL WC-3549]
MTTTPLTDTDLRHVERAVELAGEALRAGDEPFGSVLTGADGHLLRAARNRVRTGGDGTRHPEFELARWAAEHLDAYERRRTVVFTSGEHCPMCAAAHGWAGMGRIVYAHSSAQLTRWLAEIGVAPSPVAPLRIQEVVPGADTVGPLPAFTARLRTMHHACHAGRDRTA